LGKRACLKALLEVKSLLDVDDQGGYVLSRLYLEDYCVWVQSAKNSILRSLASELHHLRLDKNEVRWPLLQYEKLAEAGDDEDSDDEDSDDEDEESEESDDEDHDSEEESDQRMSATESKRPLITEL
ncbi:Hsp90 cochaperone shq1, partial [Quaeritorhiza haematococci]